jgi:hypothetical protein
MEPSFSILGTLFVGGMLLFLLLLLFMAASTKGGGGLSGRPIVTAFLFAAAIAMMAGPAVTSMKSSTYSNEHAFRMFFGRQPGENVKFLNNASGGGADYSRIMLSFELGTQRKIETFVAAAHLKRAEADSVPAIDVEKPDWWTPVDCRSPLAVYVGVPDSNWREKWAIYCAADRRVFAYALWKK